MCVLAVALHLGIAQRQEACPVGGEHQRGIVRTGNVGVTRTGYLLDYR